MEIQISINADGAAFEDNDGAEVAAILERVAAQFTARHLSAEDGEHTLDIVRDTNGNTVGSVTVTR